MAATSGSAVHWAQAIGVGAFLGRIARSGSKLQVEIRDGGGARRDVDARVQSRDVRVLERHLAEASTHRMATER